MIRLPKIIIYIHIHKILLYTRYIYIYIHRVHSSGPAVQFQEIRSHQLWNAVFGVVAAAAVVYLVF